MNFVELQPAPRVPSTGGVASLSGMDGAATGSSSEAVSLELYERLALERALEEVDGDRLAAARLLNVGKSTLYRKLKRHGIE